MTLVTKKSLATGKVHTRNIPAPAAAIGLWMSDSPQDRPHVQTAFPGLSAEDREFLLTGITPEEWDAIFPDEELS